MPEPGNTFLFNDLIPLPFRILFLIQLGATFWYLLVVILYYLSPLNVLQLINLSYSNHNYAELDNIVPSTGEFATTVPADREENTRLIRGIYNDLKGISIVNLICWAAFKVLQRYEWLKYFSYPIPAIAFAFLFYRVFYKSTNTMGQVRIFTTIKRILIGNINSISMRTNDILISDSLVSYAKVLNDFSLFMWTYYYAPNQDYDYKLEMFVLAIPTFIRIKQCYNEIQITGQRSHLFNLIKYSTNLGPLIVNALIKRTLINSTDAERKSGELLNQLNTLNNYWYFFSALNSTYSFIWDVKMDWSLGLFDFIFNINHPYKFQPLRRNLAYKKPVYYLAIVVDFMLRFIWLLKIFIIKEELEHKVTYLHLFSTFLFGYDAYSFGYTIVELLEIYRRWLWCFLKLESDWCKLSVEKVEDIELSQIKQG